MDTAQDVNVPISNIASDPLNTVNTATSIAESNSTSAYLFFLNFIMSNSIFITEANTAKLIIILQTSPLY